MNQERNYVYILSPVRKVTPEQSAIIDAHALKIEEAGDIVFNPKKDATGYEIVMAELKSLHEASKHNGRIDIFWNLEGNSSEGSRVDMGMGFALGLRYNLIAVFNRDQPAGPQFIYKTFLDKNIDQNIAKSDQDMFEIDMIGMIKARGVTIDWDIEMTNEDQEKQRFYLGMALGLKAKIPEFRIKMGELVGEDIKE